MMKKRSLINFILTLSLCSVTTYAFDFGLGSDDPQKELHWSYEGDRGVENWGDLHPSYLDCKLGKRQSPVDIKQESSSYLASDAGIYVNYHDEELNINNNGHTIAVNFADTNEALINGKKYKLKQVHFHSPSEHTIDAKSFPMEAHFVHKADDGELAVLGVMIQEGNKNSSLQKIWKNMPVEEGGHNISNKVKINATDLLPSSKDHYHYLGSLTTPPCTQIVEWYILKEPISISNKQLERFHKLYNANARPVQELNDRVILEKI